MFGSSDRTRSRRVKPSSVVGEERKKGRREADERTLRLWEYRGYKKEGAVAERTESARREEKAERRRRSERRRRIRKNSPNPIYILHEVHSSSSNPPTQSPSPTRKNVLDVLSSRDPSKRRLSQDPSNSLVVLSSSGRKAPKIQNARACQSGERRKV